MSFIDICIDINIYIYIYKYMFIDVFWIPMYKMCFLVCQVNMSVVDMTDMQHHEMMILMG